MQEQQTWQGLTAEQAKNNLRKYGANVLVPEKKSNLGKKIVEVITEPMFMLLFGACLLYFFLGKPGDGAIMLVFIFFIVTIDVIQEWKTDKTLAALKDLSSPQIKVIRDGQEILIKAEEVVLGDLMLICEGEKIGADGEVLTNDDLVVDESVLTGESVPVVKVKGDKVRAGTAVITGTAVVEVTQIGAETEYGKIGLQVAAAPPQVTPLQMQVNQLIKYSAMIGTVLLIVVTVVTWFNLVGEDLMERITDSILAGITLAMAIIPEEFPVILTVFLSMGAWRMARKQALVRRLGAIETIGAMSVLCTDKTGTLTENKMRVEEIVLQEKVKKQSFLQAMVLACEQRTYDPMEKALINYLDDGGEKVFAEHQLVKDYPFTSESKRMGHLWKGAEGKFLLTVKGSPESVLSMCRLTEKERAEIEMKQNELAGKAYRVLGLARQLSEETKFYADLSDYHDLEFLGLIALVDPPREMVPEAIATAKKAGVRVIMITGDNGITAQAIATKIGIESPGGVVGGEEMKQLSEMQLKTKLEAQVNIFARVVPADKLRIVKALKALDKVTGMIGDGVNDAPALKYANIGIAMGGKRGTQVAREAADIVILDDNFATIVKAIRDGRRIYDNIKKSVSYVFVLHIPIILAALSAPLLGIPAAAVMLLPLQVVLSELIVDPTCSIVFERQKAEPGIMRRQPRNHRKFLIDKNNVWKIIWQGIIIFSFSFGLYFWMWQQTTNVELARTMGVLTMSLASLFLVYVNSSERELAVKVFRENITDKVVWAINGGIVMILLAVIYVPGLNTLMKFQSLTGGQLLLCVSLAVVAGFWFDLVKIKKR